MYSKRPSVPQTLMCIQITWDLVNMQILISKVLGWSSVCTLIKLPSDVDYPNSQINIKDLTQKE